MKDLKLTKELTPKMVEDIKEYFSMFYSLITPIINHGKVKKSLVARIHQDQMDRINNAYPNNNLVADFENQLEDIFFWHENMTKFGHGGH